MNLVFNSTSIIVVLLTNVTRPLKLLLSEIPCTFLEITLVASAEDLNYTIEQCHNKKSVKPCSCRSLHDVKAFALPCLSKRATRCLTPIRIL